MDARTYSLNEAAELCGISPQTVRRRKKRLEEVGAICEPTGWKVTLDQLIAVGLTTKVRTAPAEVETIESLKAQLAAAEHRADRAEAIAAERERTIAVQAQALRLLEAPRTPTEPTPPAAAEEEPAQDRTEPPTEQKRGFWARLFGQ